MNKKFDFIKAIYFVAFGIIFTVIVTLVLIVPHLKDYRDATRQAERQEKQIHELEKKQEGFKTNIEKLEKEYANGFSVLKSPFNKDALMKHVPKGCELSVGEQTSEEVEGKFKKVTYDAVMIAATPADYYKFVERATQDGTLCSVDRGMVMQSIGEGKLKIGFIVTSYSYADEKQNGEHKEKKEDGSKEKHAKEGDAKHGEAHQEKSAH